MQGARGWRRWCCRAPGNEPHDSPLSNEKIRHLPEAVLLSCTAPLCRLPSGNSFDSFDSFNFFNLDIFDFRRRSEERRVGKECRSRWEVYQLKNNSELAVPA